MLLLFFLGTVAQYHCVCCIRYIRYLVLVPSFKCLTFSHQKQRRELFYNSSHPRANMRPKYQGGNRVNCLKLQLSDVNQQITKVNLPSKRNKTTLDTDRKYS